MLSLIREQQRRNILDKFNLNVICSVFFTAWLVLNSVKCYKKHWQKLYFLTPIKATIRDDSV
jgi:hypothetical protein